MTIDRKYFPSVTGALLLLSLASVGCHGLAAARQPVNVRSGAIGQIEIIVDEPDGEPVENARVRAGFYMPGHSSQKTDAETDERGRCVVTGRTRNEIFYWVTKDGYYESKGTYSCPHAARNAEPRIKNGYWQPRKPTVSVELRPIRKPIPMYVKQVGGFIPNQEKPCGYDLLRGDWVAPYGVGERKDIVVSAEGEYQDIQHRWTKTIFTFPNEYDGLLFFTVPTNKHGNMSEYMMPYYIAPEDGYESKYTHFSKLWGDIRKNVSPRDNLHFIFRVRTKVNQKGQVVESLYGKIYGDIGGGIEWGGPRIGVGFTYYLNPTGTRNLEYDPPKNLFLRKPDGAYIPPYDDFARENGYIRGRP